MKGKINFIVDAVMFLLLTAVTGLGLLMKYVLISGRERIEKFGQHIHPQFLGWDRHEWGTMHLILGIVLLVLLVLHIVLHWKSIQSLFRCLVTRERWRLPILLIFSTISLFLLLFPFFLNTSFIYSGNRRQVFHQRGNHNFSNDETRTGYEYNPAAESASGNSQRDAQAREHIRVTGSMTLNQVSENYAVPVSIILSGLGIQDSISLRTRMGQLRKMYPFGMSDVSRLIQEYKTNQPK